MSSIRIAIVGVDIGGLPAPGGIFKTRMVYEQKSVAAEVGAALMVAPKCGGFKPGVTYGAYAS